MAKNLTPPKRGYSFKDHALSKPGQPLPGDRLDAELDRITNALADIHRFLQVSLDGDGTLRGSTVAVRNLMPGAFAPQLEQVMEVIDETIKTLTQREKTSQHLVTQAQNYLKAIEGLVAQVHSAQTKTEEAQKTAQSAQKDVLAARARTESALSALGPLQLDAQTSASSARIAEDMAYRWAEKTDGPVFVPNGGDPVDSGFYSAKFHALRAGGFSDQIEIWHGEVRDWHEEIETVFYPEVRDLHFDFRSTYFGSFDTPPTQDPFGNPPTAGDLYFNTNIGTMFVWDNTIPGWTGFQGATISTFLQLTDTPSAFGTAGQSPVVNTARDALEWAGPFLPLTGGTLTGQLTLPGFITTGWTTWRHDTETRQTYQNNAGITHSDILVVNSDQSFRFRQFNPATGAYISESARVELAGTAANFASTIMTLEKGDFRYLRLAGGTLTGNLFVPQLVVNSGADTGTVAIRANNNSQISHQTLAGTVVGSYYYNQATTAHFFTNGAGVSARLDPAGASIPSAQTIITREKGDERYLRLAGGTLTGSVTLAGTALAQFNVRARASDSIHDMAFFDSAGNAAWRWALRTQSTSTGVFQLRHNDVALATLAATGNLTLAGSTGQLLTGTGGVVSNGEIQSRTAGNNSIGLRAAAGTLRALLYTNTAQATPARAAPVLINYYDEAGANARVAASFPDRIANGGTLDTAQSVVTREHGDVRYPQLNAPNTFATGQVFDGQVFFGRTGQTGALPQVVIRGRLSDNAARIRFDNNAGTELAFMQVGTDGRFAFNNGSGGGSATVARLEASGAAVPFTSSVITREKGDGRYSRFQSAFTGNIDTDLTIGVNGQTLTTTIAPGATGTHPIGTTLANGDIVITHRWDTNAAHQEYIDFAAGMNGVRVFRRQRVSGVWNSWFEIQQDPSLPVTVNMNNETTTRRLFALGGSTNGPEGGLQGTLDTYVNPTSTNVRIQTFIETTSIDPRQWFRAMAAGTWSAWQPLAGGGGGSITTGATFPPAPGPGDLHYLTVDPVGLYLYLDDGDSTQWVLATGGRGDIGSSGLLPQQDASGNIVFTFLGIPADVRQVEFMFDALRLSGTDHISVQVGDSVGFAVTGYASISQQGTAWVRSTIGMIVNKPNAADALTGKMTLSRMAGNKWVQTHTFARDVLVNVNMSYGSGRVTLAGELDRVRVNRTGTNTFTAGSVSVRWIK